MSNRPCSLWLAVLALATLSASAEISITDLQVAARALTFMEQPLSGRVRVGIVHSTRSPRSQSQAKSLATRLDSGLLVGSIELIPVLVPIEEARTAAVDMFLLTEFVPPAFPELSTISRQRQILCVTTDVAQVESGACTVAVRSRPTVEIIVNREAAVNSGVRFATAFRVMVTEI